MNKDIKDIPKAFHVLAKPAGARCNLDCAYCFYLEKAGLYQGGETRMSDEVMDSYLRQLIEAHHVPSVQVSWQGGEPTLMGLDFFRRSIGIQKKYLKPGLTIENSFQTNGMLIDEDWCRFFHDNNFLVGLSLDGPKELHDFYRKDKAGSGTFDRVVKALRLMQEYKVEFNILCTVNRKNAAYPLEVYRFFRDEMKVNFIQFIPIVESTGAGEFSDRSVRPNQWGEFLIKIFDEWVRHDVGTTYVITFDSILGRWLDSPGSACVFMPTCGLALAIEHNGDLYSCDHFVNRGNLLGNIMKTPMIDLITSAEQRKFGSDKKEKLPECCRKCDYLFLCNGECPKNRIMKAPNGQEGWNYLCAGYKAFFRHSGKAMKQMGEFLRKGRPASEIMKSPVH